MRVLILKDGTIPIVVAAVLYTDISDRPGHDGIGDIDHDHAEMFDVEGHPEALDVTWEDGDGFSVYPTTVAEWFSDRQADGDGGPISEVSAGHFVQADVSHGEDERWYSHLFDLRRV